MTIRVALNHVTQYRFDRPVGLSPHEIRLRPATHCRTPILGYSLKVLPENHFINWQQDAYGNYLARLVFPDKARNLSVTVGLIADMTVINPFDFFVEQYADKFPFEYPANLKKELAPFLEIEPMGPLLEAWIASFRKNDYAPGIGTADFLVAANVHLQRDIAYTIRMQPGVQSCEETLQKRLGSCRDTGWLLAQILRRFGLAARFVSGYLVQLSADIKALDGPAGPQKDFTDLHAWTEVYIPGAGWIGLDPTSGLLAGEGHIPLACTATPSSAAPISGYTEPCETQFEFSMTVTRIHEDPRVTKPYTEAQWRTILALGDQVENELEQGDVRLTQGGEPTFVSIDDMEGPEWNYTALSPAKRKLADGLMRALQKRFAPGSLLHFGQGKWYPGEPLPRWALGIFWRRDGKPLWQHDDLVAANGKDYGFGELEAKRYAERLCAQLGLDAAFLIPAYEDVWQVLHEEGRLPENIDPLASDLKDPAARSTLAKNLARGLGTVIGLVLPLKPEARKLIRGKPQPGPTHWHSSHWPLKREHLYLLGGESPMGMRLPLASLPWVMPEDKDLEHARDPFEVAGALPDAEMLKRHRPQAKRKAEKKPAPVEVIRTALCVQAREGRLHVFMPPVALLEDYVALLAAIEAAAVELNLPLWVEGYPPPPDDRLHMLNVTPDPGVIEVNVHPAASWRELVENTTALYEETRQARLCAEKFMLDGRHTGTGGGNHVTLGGATPADSPMLRRADLLKSLITYWQNHPALSYLFSGMFIGPTSQAPRVDEARDDNLYELEIAFQQLDAECKPGTESDKPWLIDRVLRHLLVDLTGNTHRAEFCIDKLYSPDESARRLGVLEFRAFEMPPHAHMSLVQQLLLRSLVARFWKTPYRGPLVRWGTELHDRFMLPHFVSKDMEDVTRDLRAAGYSFDFSWFAPFIEFRFPRYGTVNYDGVQLELRQAIEPWNVLGEEMASGSTARYVDSSVERLQVRVTGMIGARHIVCCNGRPLPLHPTGMPGEFVAGVRFRAWAPPSALHPTIGVHAPLVFDIVDSWSSRSVGGCTYHVSHPGGRNYDTFPVNANEAEARRVARFWDHGHTPGAMQVLPGRPNPNFPFTLDLRRDPA